MTKLPLHTNVSNNVPQAVKSAAISSSTLAASPMQTSKPIDAANTASQGKTFGDVLARHVSDTKMAENLSQPKKITTKSSEKTIDTGSHAKNTTGNSAEKMSGDMSQSKNVSDNVSEKTSGNSTQTEKVSGKTSGKAEDHTATTLPGDTSSNLIPPDMLATLIPFTAATTQAVATPQGTAAPLGQSTDTKDGLDIDKIIHSSGDRTLALGVSPIEAKRDTVFSNMMESLTAASASKLSETDEKGAALAAAPQPNALAQTSMQASPLLQTNAIPAQVTINTPVSHEKWGDEFNQKVTWLTNQKEQTAELHLNPPQLGPMDIVLKVSGDQATALFTSPHAAVREAVEQAIPKLREMLADSGIMLSNATVSDQSPRNRQESQNGLSPSARSAIGGVSDSNLSANPNVRVSPINRHNGMVDTFA